MKKSLPLILSASFFLLLSCGGGGNQSESTAPSTKTEENPTSATTPDTSAQEYDRDSISKSLIIHYHRDDKDYKDWKLWLWPKGGSGADYTFDYLDEYGGICVEPVATFGEKTAGLEIGLIVKQGNWTSKDVEEDRYLVLDELVADSKGNYEVWLYTGISSIYTEYPTNTSYLSTCAFASMDKFVANAGSGKIYKVELYKGTEKVKEAAFEGVTKAEIALDEAPAIDEGYTAKVTFENDYVISQNVSMIGLYEDEGFDALYYYDGNDLGAVYTAAKTTFKVWSPASKSISLCLYDTGTPASLNSEAHPGSDTPTKVVAMEKGEKRVWRVSVEGDLNGKYYTYRVNNYLNKDVEVVDPYAKSAGVNGLRGMIIDMDKTNPDGWNEVRPHQTDRKALTVYETHIADLTSSETWGGPAEEAKLYSGFHKKGTTYQGVKTGFDHVQELGVNAVQILPMFDQANDEVNPEFNWGYNPLNYNVPEGVYSSDPFDGAKRVEELKSLIADYTKEGINIIMDVVYNHVNSVNGLNFDVLMPYYYFRYTNKLGLSNGSGCGNETASDHSMFGKFMIDSATFWAKEYKLGGFRFDLMALHDMDTMASLTAACQKVNPGIVIYGEPWNGGSSPLPTREAANQDNADKFIGYGCFNDRIRDGLISGGLNSKTSKGWATNLTGGSITSGNDVIRGLRGNQKGSSDPDKAVTYASCHDNYTLYDRAKAAHGTSLSEEDAKKMAMLAQSVVMTSQGTSFMLAGEEMLRTKGGDDNSYKSSYKVNELDYALKVAHPDLFANYQKLIGLKQDLPGLHLGEADARKLVVNNSDDYTLISYDIVGVDGKTYRVAHANGAYKGADSGNVDFEGYTLELATVSSPSLGKQTVLAPFQTIVAYK